MSWLAYHPERVEELWRRTRLAVEDLAAITSDDPAAAGTMRDDRWWRGSEGSDGVP